MKGWLDVLARPATDSMQGPILLPSPLVLGTRLNESVARSVSGQECTAVAVDYWGIYTATLYLLRFVHSIQGEAQSPAVQAVVAA